MTNRPLTADELADARDAYNALGRLYSVLGQTSELAGACGLLGRVIDNATTDGKPLRTERVPTAADIGRAVKVRDSEDHAWERGHELVGFRGSRYVTFGRGHFLGWQYCIIDEEAAQ